MQRDKYPKKTEEKKNMKASIDLTQIPKEKSKCPSGNR